MRIAATIIALALTSLAHAQAPEVARRDKCAYLWQRVAPKHFRAELAEFFVSEHERAGIAEEWYFSLVYSYSGSDLNPRMVCRGNGMTAVGICDGTELHLSRAECIRRFGTADRGDSWVSIASHVAQAKKLRRQRGVEGWALMRAVFLPGTPKGWTRAQAERRRQQEQNGRWLPRDRRFRALLAAGYAKGEIETCNAAQ